MDWDRWTTAHPMPSGQWLGWVLSVLIIVGCGDQTSTIPEPEPEPDQDSPSLNTGYLEARWDRAMEDCRFGPCMTRVVAFQAADSDPGMEVRGDVETTFAITQDEFSRVFDLFFGIVYSGQYHANRGCDETQPVEMLGVFAGDSGMGVALHGCTDPTAEQARTVILEIASRHLQSP